MIFSTLDASKGYCLVEIDEKIRDDTELRSQDDLFCFTSSSSGLINALRTFQRAIEVLLTQVKCKFALVYLDDIAIFSHTPEEPPDHSGKVLTPLYDVDAIFNPKICELI